MPYSEGTGTLSVRIALAAAIAFTLSGCNSDSSDSDDNASISKPSQKPFLRLSLTVTLTEWCITGTICSALRRHWARWTPA